MGPVSLVRLFVVTFVGLGLIGPLAAPAAAQPAGGGSYIVVLRAGADPHAAAAELGQAHGLGVSHVYDAVLGGFAATIPNDAALEGLRRNPQVAFVEPDQVVYAFGHLATGVDRVGADNGSDVVTTGPGASVAVLDTGISSHPDLTSIAGGYNCTSGNTSAWGDGHGHGTHVAGTIAAQDGIGVAPGTPVYGMKVLSDEGSGYWSWIICGINQTAAQGIKVANMSLGGSSMEGNGCNSSSLHKAICDAHNNHGVQFAVAAGNSGSNAKGTVPAKYPEVTAVSALADSDGCSGGLGPATGYGADDTRASFSNFGDVVDVAAPGVGIYSTLPGGGYGSWNGTSMATPHVAALMALGVFGAQLESSSFGEPIVNVPGGNINCGGSTGADTEAPSAPANLVATAVSSTQVDLVWDASTDNVGVTGYNIYRDNALLATGVASTSYSDSTVAGDTTYTYEVTAKDEAGNESAKSAPAQVTTLTSTTDALPLAPSNLTATAAPRGKPTVDLFWTDNATNETGYRVYRNDGSGFYLLSELAESTVAYKDQQVSRGSTYEYCVAAFNLAGESQVCSGPVTASEGGAAGTDGAAETQMGEAGFAEGSTVVTTDAVNLRADASQRAAVITELAAGTVLTVTGAAIQAQGISWVPVVTAEGLTGYVAAEFLAIA